MYHYTKSQEFRKRFPFSELIWQTHLANFPWLEVLQPARYFSCQFDMCRNATTHKKGAFRVTPAAPPILTKAVFSNREMNQLMDCQQTDYAALFPNKKRFDKEHMFEKTADLQCRYIGIHDHLKGFFANTLRPCSWQQGVGLASTPDKWRSLRF